MARMNDWQREIHEGLRKENWSLEGMNMIVKVVPGGGDPASHLGGYITVGASLLTKTPQQIERDLGLKPRYLLNGARVYRFTRLPMQHEYTYELTADYPGGLRYNEAHGDPGYKPGSPKIRQWEIKPGTKIPVDERNFLELKPGQRFPHGWLEKL